MQQPQAADILLAKTGDEAAFSRLYNLYWAKVWNFTGVFVKDDREREDIVQQVFLNVWQARMSLDPEKSFEGLLFITTRNAVFNAVRRHRRVGSLEELLPETDVREDDGGELTEARDLENYVSSLVDQLPPRQKEAYLLSRDSGLSYREISERMGISVKGVERNIHLALKFIKFNLPLFILFIS